MLYGCDQPVNQVREESMFRCARMSVLRALSLALITCGVSAALPVAATAQSVSGTILGTVTDASGAIIADAKVTVVNEGTGLTRTVTADANGEYVVPSIPTGRYTVM